MRLTLAPYLLSALFLFLGSAHAEDAPQYIKVGNARTKKTVIAFKEILQAKSSASNISARLSSGAKLISDTLQNDLLFMDLFTFLSPDAFVEKKEAGYKPGEFQFSDWKPLGADFLLKSALSTSDTGNLIYEANLFEVGTEKTVFLKRFVGGPSDGKLIGHTAANFMVEALTGLKGIFLTKIAMACSKGSSKELYMMNFDGTEVKQLTNHHSVSFSPGWSPDGQKIAYSLIARHKQNIKNIDLYEINLQNQSVRMLSNRTGINSGAAYSPDGKKIALTMSFLGNPEVFVLNPEDSSVTRMTKSLGVSVDPSWSPDGTKMAFVSTRSGMPMVFSMGVDGTNITRLTYAGRYNATPSWSPSNNKMAFAGWLDNHFDIFLMNPDGSHIERLTKNQGNNEDPNFSPDGNFLVFSSNRTGQKNIYAMNVDGTFVKRLTFGLGNCEGPRWSPIPK